MREDCYKVYRHTTPDGKVYIGQTYQPDPNERWHNGNGYKDNKLFFDAIQRYGWNRIKHEILYDGLTSWQASMLERYEIVNNHAEDPEHGYNRTSYAICGQIDMEFWKKIADRYNKEKDNVTEPVKKEKSYEEVCQEYRDYFNEIEKKEAEKQEKNKSLDILIATKSRELEDIGKRLNRKINELEEINFQCGLSNRTLEYAKQDEAHWKAINDSYKRSIELLRDEFDRSLERNKSYHKLFDILEKLCSEIKDPNTYWMITNSAIGVFAERVSNLTNAMKGNI